MMDVVDALLGATIVGCLFAALFFVRFWRQTRDRFHLLFAVGLLLLGVNWMGVLILDANSEPRNVVYFVRFLAFVAIIVAIVDKNRREA